MNEKLPPSAPTEQQIREMLDKSDDVFQGHPYFDADPSAGRFCLDGWFSPEELTAIAQFAHEKVRAP